MPQWTATTRGPGRTTAIRLAKIESYEYDTNGDGTLRITMDSGRIILLVGDEAQDMESALFRLAEQEGLA